MSVKFTYLKQLEKDLRELDRHQALFRLLKRVLGNLGYWKNRPRGNPQKGYKVMRERKHE